METTYSSLYILGTSDSELHWHTHTYWHTLYIHCLSIPAPLPNFITRHQLLSFQQLLFAAIEPQHEILQHWHNTWDGGNRESPKSSKSCFSWNSSCNTHIFVLGHTRSQMLMSTVELTDLTDLHEVFALSIPFMSTVWIFFIFLSLSHCHSCLYHAFIILYVDNILCLHLKYEKKCRGRCLWQLSDHWDVSGCSAYPDRQCASAYDVIELVNIQSVWNPGLQGSQWYRNGVQPKRLHQNRLGDFADAKKQPFKGKRKIRIHSRAQEGYKKKRTKGLWMPQQWQLHQDSICTH